MFFELHLSFFCQSAYAADSFVGAFTYKPFDAEVDWSFVAKASPCYMTVCYFDLGMVVVINYFLFIKWLQFCSI